MRVKNLGGGGVGERQSMRGMLDPEERGRERGGMKNIKNMDHCKLSEQEVCLSVKKK